VLFVLVSGCIKINVDQKISSNGIMDTTMEIDYSQLANAIPQAEGTQPPDFSTFCEQQREQFEARENLISFKCTSPEKFKSVITAKERLDGSIFIKEDGLLATKYRYDLGAYQKYAEQFSNNQQIQGLPDDGQANISELTDEQIQQLALAGFEITYTVEMPGTITTTNIGKIENNKVVISLAELSKLNDPNTKKVIISEQTSFLFVLSIIIGVFLFIVVGVVLIYFFVIKKPSAARGAIAPPQQPAQQARQPPQQLRQQPQQVQPPPQQMQQIKHLQTKPVQQKVAPQQMQSPPQQIPRRLRFAKKPQAPSPQQMPPIVQPQAPVKAANVPLQAKVVMQKPLESETKTISLNQLSTQIKKTNVKTEKVIKRVAPPKPIVKKPLKPIKKIAPPKPIVQKQPIAIKKSVQQKPLQPKKKITPKKPLKAPIILKTPQVKIKASPEKIARILSAEEQNNVKSLVSALESEKNNFTKEQITKVIVEKGYNKVIAEEVIKQLYG